MTKRSGFYALVQYCPDRARGEGVNIGVVVCDPESRTVAAQVGEISRARRLKHVGFDVARTHALADALVARLRDAWSQSYQSAEGIEAFTRREPNAITLTKPRACTYTNADEEVRALFAELVVDRAVRKRTLRFVRPLRAMAEELKTHEGVRQVESVAVPVLNKPVKAELAYLNGRTNVVAGHVFGADIDLVQHCTLLTTQGLLISKNEISVEGFPPRKGHLILVGEFSSSEQQQQVTEILRSADVETVSSKDLEQLRQRIENEAHEPETETGK
jgi:hypothetical protein